MWLCLNSAFLSVVHKDCAADELLVRARRAGDIRRVFPKAKVQKTPHNDYLYRAVVKREQVTAALAKAVEELNYSNFKASTKERDLHDAYSRVWHVLGDLQPGGPYAGYPITHHQTRRKGYSGGGLSLL
jgi:hypothetical protein